VSSAWDKPAAGHMFKALQPHIFTTRGSALANTISSMSSVTRKNIQLVNMSWRQDASQQLQVSQLQGRQLSQDTSQHFPAGQLEGRQVSQGVWSRQSVIGAPHLQQLQLAGLDHCAQRLTHAQPHRQVEAHLHSFHMHTCCLYIKVLLLKFTKQEHTMRSAGRDAAPTCVHAKIQGMARSVSIDPWERRFAGREPMFMRPSSFTATSRGRCLVVTPSLCSRMAAQGSPPQACDVVWSQQQRRRPSVRTRRDGLEEVHKACVVAHHGPVRFARDASHLRHGLPPQLLTPEQREGARLLSHYDTRWNDRGFMSVRGTLCWKTRQGTNLGRLLGRRQRGLQDRRGVPVQAREACNVSTGGRQGCSESRRKEGGAPSQLTHRSIVWKALSFSPNCCSITSPCRHTLPGAGMRRRTT
jgi:hypothetical protein